MIKLDDVVNAPIVTNNRRHKAIITICPGIGAEWMHSTALRFSEIINSTQMLNVHGVKYNTVLLQKIMNNDKDTKYAHYSSNV